MLETKFHVHTEQKVKLYLSCSNLYVLKVFVNVTGYHVGEYDCLLGCSLKLTDVTEDLTAGRVRNI